MDRLVELSPELWEAAVQTLYMVSLTLLFGGILGGLIGVGLYLTRPGGMLQNRVASFVLNLFINFFRPIPFVILITVLIPFSRFVVGSGIGTNAAIVALVVASMFAIGRIVEQHLVGVSPGVIEAARAMGAGPWRTLFSVVIPEALGPLVLGYTFVIVALIDMTAMAGYIGAGGLGNFALTYGRRQFEPLVMWAAVLLIVVFVHLAQTLGTWAARRIMRR